MTLARLISGSGGAGLVGGALLMDAFEDHEDRQEEQAYDQGQSLPEKLVCTF
jgi:mevalonate pyrophosphate decarboxylase